MTSPPTDRSAGFTLIEMIVVLAILAGMVGLLIARGPQRSAALDLRVTADRMISALRATQARAIRTNQPAQFTLDAPHHAYQTPGQPPVALPGTALNGPSITFAPDGSATGGTIQLSNGLRQLAIDISWLTGRVSLAHGG